MEIILIKSESGGFAYSDHEKVIKLNIRPARDGWFFEERAGTKGGTLTAAPTVTVKDEASAVAMLKERIANEESNGYRRAS